MTASVRRIGASRFRDIAHSLRCNLTRHYICRSIQLLHLPGLVEHLAPRPAGTVV
jgi:hypothetical protein